MNIQEALLAYATPLLLSSDINRKERVLRFWLSKSSEVPLREQLATQVILGIVSGDLKPNQRLQSTRELARRFSIHSNTVNAAYRDLAERGWVEIRKGSGVYVRAINERPELGARLELDQLVSSLLQTARLRGFSLVEVQSRIKQWLELQPPDQFLVIESDVELRAILMAEISEATRFRVSGIDLETLARPYALTGSIPVSIFGQANVARAALPPDVSLLVLRARSVAESLRGKERPRPDALIFVISRWPEFLKWTRTILVAAGVDPNCMIFRDARERSWQNGLRSSTFVITDALTAQSLPEGCDARVFRIIADSSIEELRLYVERFLEAERN